MGINEFKAYIEKNRDVHYKVSFIPLPQMMAEHKWVGGQWIDHVLYGIPNDMDGILKYSNYSSEIIGSLGSRLFKWTGGCYWHGCLYGFSRTSNSLLKLCIGTGKIDYVTGNYIYSGEHHYGGVCTEDGYVFQPPRDSDHILMWDLKKGFSQRIVLDGEKHRYCGSILHPNGNIYFLPELNDKVIQFNIITREWSYIGNRIDAMVFDAKLAVDGNIYGFSAYCDGILKLDVKKETAEMIHREIHPGAYGTKQGMNGHLYSIPGDGNIIWDYDPLTDSLDIVYEFSYCLKAKYAGGASTTDGMIYAVPARDNSLLVLTPDAKVNEIPDMVYREYYMDCY